MAVATEEHLPLSQVLEAWAADERGRQRVRVRRLAALLKEGMPLPEAVEEVREALRDEDVLAIRFGAQSGTLAASIRQQLADAEWTTSSSAHRFRPTLLYGVIVAALFAVITAYLYLKIVPKFNAILEDFELQRPKELQRSIEFAEIVERFWWLVALTLLALIWSAFSARPGRFVRHAILARLFQPLAQLRSADVLQKLSVAANAGRPIPGALSTLARYHHDPSLRRQLLYVRNEVEQGVDVWQSLTAAGLLTASENKLLATADRVGNRPWALRQIALGKKRRTLRWLERMADLFLPVVVLVLGAFVLFQALSLFVPLVRIVMSLL